MNVLLRLLLMFFLMACDADYQVDDAPIQTTQCLMEPRSQIVEENVRNTLSSSVGANFTLNRSENGDLTVHDLVNDCYVSISSRSGEMLVFPDPENVDIWFLRDVDEYQRIVVRAEAEFLHDCERTDRFQEELRMLNSISVGAIETEIQIPCDSVLERHSVFLLVQTSKDTGPIGGVSIIDEKIYIWKA